MNRKKMLIIGGTGTLGESMVEKFSGDYNIYIVSRDETKQSIMKIKYPDVNFMIGDMKDYEVIKMSIIHVNPHIIIINGALKYIDICENNVKECLETNVIGVQNVIIATTEKSLINLQTVIFISTDKSCYPVSVYGFSKAISERILAEASLKCQKSIKYVSVRLGNLLNSTGSLIPKFIEIGTSETKKEFQVTNAEMTRFFMTLEQCTSLIQTVINHSESGEVWIPAMSAYRILDIAQFFSKKYNKPIKITGLRPGEKIHEILVNEVEMVRTQNKVIKGQQFYIIKSCYQNYHYTDLCQPYSSQNITDFKPLKLIILNLLTNQ